MIRIYTSDGQFSDYKDADDWHIGDNDIVYVTKGDEFVAASRDWVRVEVVDGEVAE